MLSMPTDLPGIPIPSPRMTRTGLTTWGSTFDQSFGTPRTLVGKFAVPLQSTIYNIMSDNHLIRNKDYRKTVIILYREKGNN